MDFMIPLTPPPSAVSTNSLLSQIMSLNNSHTIRNTRSMPHSLINYNQHTSCRELNDFVLSVANTCSEQHTQNRIKHQLSLNDLKVGNCHLSSIRLKKGMMWNHPIGTVVCIDGRKIQSSWTACINTNMLLCSRSHWCHADVLYI